MFNLMKKWFVLCLITTAFIAIAAVALPSCDNSSNPDIHSADSSVRAAADTIKANADTLIRKVDSTIKDKFDTAASKIKAAK
jgi:uncharacterized protein YpmS